MAQRACLTTQRTYDLIADEYSSRHAMSSTFNPLLTRFCAQLPSTGLILDAGCGHGRDASNFRDLGFRTVGIDYAIEMVRFSLRRSIHALQMDMRALGFVDGIFDGIWANSSLHHVASSDVSTVCREFARVLKPEGKIFLSCRADLSNNWDEEYPNCPRYYNTLASSEVADFLELASFIVSSVEYVTSPKSHKSWFCIWATKTVRCAPNSDRYVNPYGTSRL